MPAQRVRSAPTQGPPRLKRRAMQGRWGARDGALVPQRGVLLRQLHEARKLQLALRDLLGPDHDLLGVLPLEDQTGYGRGTGLDAVGELVVLAVELDAADRALVVGLFELSDHLVRIGRAGALDRLRDEVDFVIGGVAGVGRRRAE